MKNFLSVGSVDIELANLSTINRIVGTNNTGKTNVFRALEFIGKALRMDQASLSLPSTAIYHKLEVEKPYEIEVSILPDDQEVAALVDSLALCLAASGDDPNFFSLPQEKPKVHRHELKMLAIEKLRDQVFGSFFKSNLSILIKGGISEYYPPQVSLHSRSDHQDLFFHWWGTITSNPLPSQSYEPISLIEGIADELVTKQTEFAKYVLEEGLQMPSIPPDYYASNIFQLINKTPTGVARGIDFNRFRVDQVQSIFGNSEIFGRLRLFFRYRGLRFDQSTTIGVPDLVMLIYLSSIISVSEEGKLPSPPLLEDFEQMDFPFHELSYNSLPYLLFQLENSESVRDIKKYQKIQQLFKDLTDALSFNVLVRPHVKKEEPGIKFSAVPLNDDTPFIPETKTNFALGFQIDKHPKISNKLSIEIVDKDMSLPIESSAAGLTEALLLATAIGGKEHCTILLDEPGQKMHPTLQKRLLEEIDNSVAKMDNQFLIITHSPYLVSARDLNGLWRFNKESGSSSALNVGLKIDELRSEDKEKLIRYFDNADIRSLLFAKGIVLVEGVSDKIVIEKVDRFLATEDKSCDLSSKEWSVIDVGGKDSFLIFVRLCKALKLPYIIVGDYDALMQLGKKVSGASCRTSAILLALLLTEDFNGKEVTRLKEVKKQVVEKDKACWYLPELIKEFRSLGERHNVFVFTRDLENALRMGPTSKDKKPLNAVESLREWIDTKKVPDEFELLGKFLMEKVS